ncbi:MULTISPECIES: DUF302 domain-containing protein [Thiomicrorhabdus]|uniref:DUF302 domain-containing protein n=1 Tax=Thiomicrorhabdus heinhorstiae TaxID=2748010 RepID=A0ABS0BYR5_9GAMM|nr:MULTISPECIES: DUF302 domain-containing protein [Thiomicrorhabdus]MBF6058190.1 DUF302 domain-containing protein [Thiomicrorhabdus heinhorstiae]
MKLINLFKAAVLAASVATLSGCGTINAATNLEDGAWDTFNQVWDKWVASEGDIADATMWEVKVDEGVSLEDVKDAINAVGINRNLKNVGELPLSEELKARGIESKVIHVMSFCNPETARKMVDFSPAMGGFLPCRVNIIEKEDGLHIYSMNMDMAIEMGKKMPPALKEATMQVRNTIWEMMQKGKAGEF